MKIAEVLLEERIVETKMAWKKRGDKVVRQFRCGFGQRKGRVVSNPDQCTKPIDIKKRFALKRTKQRWGSRLVKKAQRAKRINPASRRLNTLNKSSKVKLGAHKPIIKKSSDTRIQEKDHTNDEIIRTNWISQ